MYPGHRQPELPGELGFYDLRVPEIRYRQAQLAREHGISGFLYYHYWFGGRRMLGRPFDEVLRSGQPDFPFALCWANESWFRRWQGSVDEMLMEQVFSEDDDIAHIRWLIKCFEDPRYIRVEGRPLLAVYRAQHLPDPRRTVEVWRSECERAGVAPPWLVMFETEDEELVADPALRGFDASAEFVPHQLASLVHSKPRIFGPDRSNRLFEYDEVAGAYMHRREVGWLRYPCVATGWDNSPRRQEGEALILHGSTPEGYGRWLTEAARRQKQSSGRNGIVFVNAWNEWAEGAHLEPDDRWGRAYLEATREALGEVFGKQEGDQAQPRAPVQHPVASPSDVLYDDLYEQFVALQTSASGFLAYSDRRISELKKHYDAKVDWARHKGEMVAELNEWLYEQLRVRDEQMRKLGLTDSSLSEWLQDPELRPGHLDAFGDEGDGEFPKSSNSDASGGADETPPSREVELDPRRPQVDELRRDDGYDDLPTMQTPQWLVDMERDAAE